MKRKLLVTLVASALELYAAAAGAQAVGSCNVPGIVNGATPVRVGPLNPTDGFPEYVTDSNGVTVQRCLDPLVCFFDPVVLTDPFSIQIGSGGEAFYWGASSTLFNAAGNRIMTAVFAAETAFLQNGPNGEPIDGSQFPFLRLRFTIGVPTDGTYTVVHPYGTDVFTVTGATGARDVFSTVDRGLTPNSTVTGSVGPFLKWDPTAAVAPAGFLGDGGAAGAINPVVGSPCGPIDAPWNFVQITGVDTAGNPVDFGGGTGETVILSDLFSVQGKLFDAKVQTPLNPTRLTYSRTAAGGGQIDSFATSTATAAVTVVDGPTIVAGTGRIAAPVTLDSLALSPTVGIDSFSVPVRDASAMPAIVSMTAKDLTAVVPTDDTTLNLHLVDFVDIAAADFDPASNTLSVTASSGDERAAPVLTLREFGTFTAGQATKLVVTTAPPSTVTVDSANGGSATAKVRVNNAVAPSAPTGLLSTAQTSLTVTLSWTDTSTNETSFKIYTVSAGGVRTPVGTVGANVTTAVISGLTAGTVYTFQVDAANAVGAAGSNTSTVSTLALPVAPSAVAATLGTTRAINVSWNDNSADETSFQILRATAVGGPYAQVATAVSGIGTGVRSIVDVSGPPAINTTYFYRVVAVRGVDSSTVAQSAGLTTPAAAQSATGLTATVASATQVNLAWTNRAGATSIQVFRSAGTGAFTLLPAGTLAATATTFNDTTVTAGTSYRYRVDEVNWAGSTQSAVTAAVTPQAAATLVAPTALTASAANSPVLNWVDQSTGETAYRVRRTANTVNANGTVTVGAVTTLSSTVASAAAPATGGARTFTDGTATGNATVLYDVAALSGTTVGPLASVFDVAGGMQTANRPTATPTNATARVTVTWTAPGNNAAQASIGGYEVQRCTGLTCTNFVKVPGTAVNTAGTVDGRATLSFIDNTVARNTGYTYRMRTVGGTGTGFLGAFSTTRTVSTN